MPAPHPATEQASPWVARFAPQAPAGTVLDLACGGGRHAALFAGLGHEVQAVDRNAEALAGVDALGQSRIRTVWVDLELPLSEALAQPAWPLQPQYFAAVVVTNYLYRPLLPLLFDSLAAGGLLIYETFAIGNEKYGKPSNPAFLLQPGELLDQAAQAGPGFHVLAYEDGTLRGSRPSRVQRICVLRSAAGGDGLLSA